MDLRLGVIGTGAIGREHIKRFTEKITGCTVTAVSDINQEMAMTVAKQYGIQHFATGEELIASEQVDAVVVTSWDETHAQYVLASIAHGKYVFCEKPLATKSEECRKIVEAEVAFGKRIVQVGFMRRYDPGYTALKNVIQSGAIGEPLIIHACHRNMTHTDTMTSEMSIKNSGIHEIDIFRWLLEDEYVKGQVVLPRANQYAAQNGLQDPQIMMLRTTKGIAIDVEISQSSGYGYDIQCEVVGELGTAKLPTPASVITKLAGQCASVIQSGWETRFIEAYDIEFQTWVDAVKADRITGPTAWDGYAACNAAEILGECRVLQSEQTIPQLSKPSFYEL
ncbi:MAG: Gfo/Idh/MocA family protein [Lachnospiraceae bacterium]